MYNKKVYKALADLPRAVYEILDAWNNDKDFSSVMDKCNDTYPFHDSFGEVCFKVESWINAIMSRIQVLGSCEEIYNKLMDSADDNETRMKILDMVREQLEEDSKYSCMGSDEE